MPEGRPGVAVAASGGRDSTALLHCVARAARDVGIEVHALHVHHGLQPAADDWQRHLAAQCRRWARSGLPVRLHVHRLATAPPRGASVEAWARRERYAALAMLARGARCDVVLLAHHRRDQAETVLLQALRGGGARGLAAMPAVAERDGLRWCRPWLAQPREAVEAYVARHRLSYVDDGSNADPRHARNRLRLQAWPPLQAAFTDAETALCAVAAHAQEQAACVRALAELDGAVAVDAAGGLDVAAWLRLDPPRRSNLLRHWLAGSSGRGVPDTLLQRLLAELPHASRGSWPTPAGTLRLYRDRLALHADAPAAPTAHAPQRLDLSRPGCHALAPGQGRITVVEVDRGGLLPDRLRHAELRPRCGGEAFQPQFGRPARALKKQFQALAVPAWERTGPLVYADDGALLFVAGLGIDARHRAPAGVPQLALTWAPDPGG